MGSDANRTSHYKFQLSKNDETSFNIPLENKTLDLIRDTQKDLPPWTKLSYHKCPNFPLDEQQHEHCPIAVSLVENI